MSKDMSSDDRFIYVVLGKPKEFIDTGGIKKLLVRVRLLGNCGHKSKDEIEKALGINKKK